jgi:hypothetical protein
MMKTYSTRRALAHNAARDGEEERRIKGFSNNRAHSTRDRVSGEGEESSPVSLGYWYMVNIYRSNNVQVLLEIKDV